MRRKPPIKSHWNRSWISWARTASPGCSRHLPSDLSTSSHSNTSQHYRFHQSQVQRCLSTPFLSYLSVNDHDKIFATSEELAGAAATAVFHLIDELSDTLSDSAQVEDPRQRYGSRFTQSLFHSPSPVSIVHLHLHFFCSLHAWAFSSGAPYLPPDQDRILLSTVWDMHSRDLLNFAIYHLSLDTLPSDGIIFACLYFILFRLGGDYPSERDTIIAGERYVLLHSQFWSV